MQRQVFGVAPPATTVMAALVVVVVATRAALMSTVSAGTAHPLRRRRVRLHVVSGADGVLAARAERVHLQHVGQVQVVQPVDAAQVGLLVAEHVPQAHLLQGGRGVQHGSVREPRHLQLEPRSGQQAPEHPRPTAPPVRRLDQPLLQPGEAVARGHLPLLAWQHQYGGHRRVRAQADGRCVQPGLVAGQESAAPHGRGHWHQAPLSGRRPHHEVHFAVPAFGGRALAARL